MLHVASEQLTFRYLIACLRIHFDPATLSGVGLSEVPIVSSLQLFSSFEPNLFAFAWFVDFEILK